MLPPGEFNGVIPQPLPVCTVSFTTIAITVFTARRVCIARTTLSQDVCPSVCPSHAGILSTPLNISSKFLYRQVATPFYSFSIPNGVVYSDGDTPNAVTGAPNARWVRKKSRFSTSISFYLRKDTTYGHSYYGMRIEHLTSNGSIFNYLEWPLTQTSRSRHYLSLNISEVAKDTAIVAIECKVTQGRWKWYHSKAWVWFPIRIL